MGELEGVAWESGHACASHGFLTLTTNACLGSCSFEHILGFSNKKDK
jgi:hypothetical protein